MATRNYPDCTICCGSPECGGGYVSAFFGTSGLCPNATIAASPVVLQAEFTVDKAGGVIPPGFDTACIPDTFILKFRSYTINSTSWCGRLLRICFGQNFGDQPDWPDFKANSNMILDVFGCTAGSYNTCIGFTAVDYPDPDFAPQPYEQFKVLCGGVYHYFRFPIPVPNPIAYPVDSYTCSPFEVICHGSIWDIHTGAAFAVAIRLTLADDCSNPFGTPDPWWCTPDGCVRAASAPEGATGGPFPTSSTCLESCASANKYWCLYGQCVRGTTRPHADATGPYSSPGECVTNCPGPAEMVWICTDAGCGQKSKAYVVIDGKPWYSTKVACQGTCPSEFYCTSYGCIEWWDPSNPPLDASSGPYSTLSACQGDCGEFDGAGYYCVEGTCGYYSTRPAGAFGPKYASMFACTPNCYVVDPAPGLVMGPAPGSLDGLNNQPILFASTPPPMQMDETRRRITIPCIHLGEKIGDEICSPCQKLNELRACAIHGKCRRKGLVNAEAGEKECFSCEQYEPPVSR